MKYSNGLIELNDSEVAILELYEFGTVERAYPASTFVGILEDVKSEARIQMHNYMIGEQTDRSALQIEMIQMLINTCDSFLRKLEDLTEGIPLRTHLN